MFQPPALRRVFVLLAQFREWAALSVSGLLAVAAGIVALAATAVVFGGVTEDVTRHNGVSRTDPTRLRWFIDHRPHGLVTTARVLSEVGGPVALGLVAVVAAVLLWWRGQRLLVALAPGIAFGVSGVGVAAGKLIVGRNRPPVPLHLITETDASFPSGHATEATAVFITLALVVAAFVLRRPIVRAATVLGAGLLSGAIGASRLVLGVHWPSDVLAGWALGAGTALAVTLVASLAAHVAPARPVSSRPIARFVQLVTRERRPRPLEAA